MLSVGELLHWILQLHRFDATKDLEAVTDTRQYAKELVDRLAPTQLVAVVRVLEVMLDSAAQSDAAEGIRQGREDVTNGRVHPAREVLEAFRRSRGIPKR